HPAPSPVAAITAGLAKLKDRTVASYAAEFLAAKEKRTKKFVQCEVICNHFLEFMRKQYDEHYKGSSLPESLREGPEFLLRGFGRDDYFPSIFRVKVKENTVVKDFGPGTSSTGVAWNGQSDAVERFIRGYDVEIRRQVNRTVIADLKSHSDKIKNFVAG